MLKSQCVNKKSPKELVDQRSEELHLGKLLIKTNLLTHVISAVIDIDEKFGKVPYRPNVRENKKILARPP